MKRRVIAKVISRQRLRIIPILILHDPGEAIPAENIGHYAIVALPLPEHLRIGHGGQGVEDTPRELHLLEVERLRHAWRVLLFLLHDALDGPVLADEF